MKKIIIILILFLILSQFLCVKKVNAESSNNKIDKVVDMLETKEIENAFQDNALYNSIKGDSFNNKIKNLIYGNYDLEDFVKNIIFDLSNNKSLLGQISLLFVIIILMGITNVLKSSSSIRGMSDTTTFVTYLIVVIISSTVLFTSINSVKNVINKTTKNIDYFFPLIFSSMIISGMNNSAIVYRPIVATTSNVIIKLNSKLIIPIILLFTLLNFLSNLSDSIKLKKAKELFSSILKWTIGLVLGIYSILLSVKGITASSLDGISLKAIKYSAGSIPIVGGFLSESSQVFISSAFLIKNAVGKFALIMLFYSFVGQFFSLLITKFMFDILGALVEPFADSKISDTISGLSKCYSFLIAVLLMVFFIYFIMIMLLIIGVSGV